MSAPAKRTLKPRPCMQDVTSIPSSRVHVTAFVGFFSLQRVVNLLLHGPICFNSSGQCVNGVRIVCVLVFAASLA